MLVYTTEVVGQLSGLSKEACLYAGADWLSSSVGQGGDRSTVGVSNCASSNRRQNDSLLFFFFFFFFLSREKWRAKSPIFE